MYHLRAGVGGVEHDGSRWLAGTLEAIRAYSLLVTEGPCRGAYFGTKTALVTPSGPISSPSSSSRI